MSLPAIPFVVEIIEWRGITIEFVTRRAGLHALRRYTSGLWPCSKSQVCLPSVRCCRSP